MGKKTRKDVKFYDLIEDFGYDLVEWDKVEGGEEEEMLKKNVILLQDTFICH